jgi:photosystem II stability/assembly factor-like uncharacterized protein
MNAYRTPNGVRILWAVLVISCGVASAAHAATLFALVDTGELFASTNAGATWENRSVLAVRDAVGLVAGETTDELYLVTRSGMVYFSSDAGVGWTSVGAVAAPDIEAVAVRRDGALLLLTATGTIWVSDDGGVSFTALGALTGANHVSLARARAGSEALYALTATGEVAESVDDGMNWVPKGAIPIPDAVEILEFGGDLIVLTGTGDVLRSLDEGATWVAIGTLSQVHSSGLTADPALNLLAAATEEGEVATSADGVTWTWTGAINQLAVNALANDTPSTSGVPPEGSPALRFRAGLPWPNPARAGSDWVTFPFSLPQAGRVEVRVYDAHGRLVALRTPLPFAAGEQVLTLGSAHLVPGVYFTRFTTDAGLETSTRWTIVR